jgi:predicted  nucleic acid-binding Zn ribbon protein
MAKTSIHILFALSPDRRDLFRSIMFTAEIKVFHSAALEVASDLLTELLACWYKNGQIAFSPSPFAAQDKVLRAFVLLPAEDSLDAEYANIYARAALSKLDHLDARVEIIVLGPDPQALKACACVRHSGVILYTHYLCTESPVRCARCFLPVPLYRLPHIRDHEYFDVISWAVNYRACDALQMQCTVGERYHERQLVELNSDLTKSGLALRASMAEALQQPVYYFLYKSRGASRGHELKRRCPSCSGDWLLAAPWHRFDFQCEACMLVSAIASTLR